MAITNKQTIEKYKEETHTGAKRMTTIEIVISVTYLEENKFLTACIVLHHGRILDVAKYIGHRCALVC